MPEFFNVDSLIQGVNNVTPTAPTTPNGSPYTPINTTSNSKYLQGWTGDRDPNNIKAVNQGFWDTMGNSLAQTAAGIPLEIAEGIGYLGVGNIIDKVRGTEEEFGNSFSNKMREWNEQLKQQGLPVFTTPDSEGFKPGDYKWWAANAPSIASAVSLAIPAGGLIKGLGKLGKAVGGLNLAKRLGLATGVLETGEALGMAAVSRHMESMMEGMEVFTTLKQQALDAGKSEDEALEIASRGASDTYVKEIPLLIGDFVQFGLAFKGFKNLSRINQLEKSSKRTIAAVTGELATQGLLEGGEEAYQYAAGKESERDALIQSKIQEDDYSSFPKRLMKYAAEGDFWTSAFMGALGGVAFHALGEATGRGEREKQQIQQDALVSTLEKATAVAQNDPQKFAKSIAVDLEKIMIAGIEGGRADKVEEMLKTFQANKFEGIDDEEAAYLKDRATQALDDLKYLESVYNDIHKDPTKARDLELTRLEMSNRAEIRSNLRFNAQLAEVQLGSVAKIAEERQWMAPYPELLKTETEIDILRNELAGSAEKDVITNRIQALEKQAKQHRDTILTNEKVLNPNFSEKDLNNRLNINKSELRSRSIHKVLSDVSIDQNNKDYDKLQTKEGRESLKKDIADFKDKEDNKEFHALVAKITPNSTFEELKGYKAAAKQMGKEEEFKQEYNKTLNNIRGIAPKFDPGAPELSLQQRWDSAPLLQETELGELTKMALGTGGLSSYDGQTPAQSIADAYDVNPVFANKVNQYYAKTGSFVGTIKKNDVGKQPTTANPQEANVDNSTAVKKPITDTQVKNKSAWNLQGQQFALDENGVPDVNKPLDDNLAKKINWDFLNTGQLPDSARLHFEYDFEDTWNKKNLGQYKALFELAYYKDSNTNNKQSTNRFVVGVLSAYDDSFTYETPEAKAQLKKLRENLMLQVQASGNRTGIIGLNASTKLNYIIGGRFWNTKRFSNVADVLRDDVKPVFAVGVRHDKANASNVVLETNGHPLQDRITYSKATEGSTYLILQAPGGAFWPYKLYTKKLKEYPNGPAIAAEEVRKIKDVKTEEEKSELLESIRSFVYIHNINYGNGLYTITTEGGAKTSVPNQVKEDELESFLGDLVLQIDKDKINTPEYNKMIIEREFVTTDLNRFTNFHSTKVTIDPVSISVPVSSVTVAPATPAPNVISTTVSNKLAGAIKGAGSTQVVIGKGKPSLVEEESSYSPLTEEGVKGWFAKNLPQVDLSFTDNLIEMHRKGGVKAWGLFNENGITLFKGAPKGTEHHEAFHAVFGLINTTEQREAIMNEASQMYNIPRGGIVRQKVYVAGKLREDIGDQYDADEQIEERLADDFMRYVQQDAANAGSLGYNVKNFFKKLWEFIKSVFTTDIDVESLFYRINTGFYKDAKIGDSSSIRYKTADDPYITKRNVNLVNRLFFQALGEYKKANSLQDQDDIAVIKGMSANTGDNLFSLYQTVYNGLYEAAVQKQAEGREDQVNELVSIMNQLVVVENGIVIRPGSLYERAKRDLSKYGIKVYKNEINEAYDAQTDEQQEEVDEDRVVQEGWQDDNITKNGKDSLSYKVRKTLRQVPQYALNESNEFEQDQDQFGFPKFVNFDEIYNYLERHLADSFDIDSMMAELEDLKYLRPEIKGIIDALNEDSSLTSQFFSNFAKAHIPFISVQERKTYEDQNTRTEFRVFNANRKNLLQILVDDWYNNLITPSRNRVTDKSGKIDSAKANAALVEFNAAIADIKKRGRNVTLEDSKKISGILDKFGIKIEPEALQKQNRKGLIIVGDRMFPRSAFDSYMKFVDSPEGSFRSLITSIAGGVNPYKGASSEASTAKVLARALAKNTTNLHQDTFFNVEGKQVYSYLLPTFINKKLQDFKSQTSRSELMTNWWFKSNKWLQELSKDNNADVIKNFDVILLDGLLRNNKKGKKYFDMTDQELDITDLNMYDNHGARSFAYYRVPILSDSPQAPYITFKKYAESEVIDAFYQLALAERDRINIANNTEITIKNFNDINGRGKEYQFVTLFNDPTIDIANEEKAKEAISGWLNSELEKEKLRLINNGVLTKAGNFDSTISDRVVSNPNFLKEYFLNKVLANAMMTQLFSVDLAFYSSSDDFQKRNGQIFKFTKMMDVDANWNGNTPEKTYKTIYLNDVKINSELKEVTYNDLISKGYDEEYATRVSSLYDGVNQTDAQTYITVDRYKKIQIGLGEWNNEKERVYQKVKRGKATDAEAGAVFAPIKPFYFGHELIPGTDLVVPVQHKNSEVVLLPNLAKKSAALSKVLKHMEDHSIDSVQFTSSVKVGQYGAATVDNMQDAFVHIADNKYFGIQQETPSHHLDTENLLGTQLKKLIIADIPDGTKIGKYTKKQIVDAYQKLLTSNIIDSYNELKKDTNSFEKIQAILTEEIIERNLGEYYENAIEAVDVNGRKDFNLPLYHPVHAKRFEAILNSLVRNRVTKQKINGGSFVLMSNFGFTDKLKIVMKPEGGVDYMEVMLPPWTKKWFPRKPNGEVDIEAIKAEDPAVLDLFGYRIPTEHKYSMKKLRVVGFTPDIMGGIAMLPAETTTIAGEDFDIDKMYVMAPNMEQTDELDKEGPNKIKKVKYNIDKIETLDKQQRDNAIIDIMQAIWSAPQMSDQILEPGGFENLKRLATNSRNRQLAEGELQNPILPRTQSLYFIRNSNGSQLIGIAANHNTNHAIAQFGNVELTNAIMFNRNTRKSLSKQKDINGRLVSRNLAEFLAAFVDNAKDPVAGDLNLNTFTFDTVALIIRAGFDLDTAIGFITQPAIQAYAEEYFKLGGSRNAEWQAYDKVKKDLEKNRKLEVKPGIYDLTLGNLRESLATDMTMLDDETAEQQLKVLFTFKKYKEISESLAKFVRATRNDKLGTRKTLAGNTKALRDVEIAIADTKLTGHVELLSGDKYPLVPVSTEYGIERPMKEILNNYFPYAKEAYQALYSKLEENKGNELTENEITYVNNQTLIHYLSNFGFFKNKEKSDWVNKYPSHFLTHLDNPKINQFELIKYLKFIPKENDGTVDKIEFVSGATISDEQRTTLTMSWEAMLNSDDSTVQKVAKDLVKYSFHTNGLSFTYGGFSHLIPTTYLDTLVDDNDTNFREYLYNLQDDAKLPDLFANFKDQLFRHNESTGFPFGLLPKLDDKTIANKKTSGRTVTSIIPKKEIVRVATDGTIESQYFKFYNAGRYHTYKFSGITGTGDYIYNLVEPLGLNNIYEYSLDGRVETVIPSNKLPKFQDKDYFDSSESDSQEFYQVNNTRELETRYGLVDSNGVYKSYGKDSKGQSSTKAYKNLITDLAKINQALKNTPYKAVYGKQPDGKGEVNWIGRIVDETYQMESTYGLSPDEQLNDVLKATLDKLGIKVEYYNELFSKTGRSVNAMADITQKLIRISKGNEKIDTLPEEVGHFAEAYNRGSAAHARLMEIVSVLPEYREVLQEYASVYGDNDLKMRQETIGKLIGKALITKTRTVENKTLLDYIKKLWNDFINLFKSADESKLRSEIEDITGEIAQDVLSGNLVEKESIAIDGVFYQLGSDEMDEAAELLKKGIDSIHKKIKIYQEKALNDFTEKEKNLLNTLVKDLNDKMYKEGLLNYVINAKKELKSIAKRYEKIERNPKTLEEKRETIKTLKLFNNYTNGFKTILNEIVNSGILTGREALKAANTAAIANQLENQYYKIGKPILATMLKEFSSNDKLNVSGALDVLEKDISWTQRFLDQLAEANDSILNIMDVMVKDAKQRGRLKTLDFSKDILEEQKALEKAGIKSTQFMYERDFSGALTGNILQEYNYGEYNKQKRAFYTNNPRPKREDFAKAEDWKIADDAFIKKQAAWYETNNQENPNAPKIIEEKKAEFKSQYSNEKLATQKFNEWLADNTIQVSYFDYQHGEQVEYTKHIKELSLPAEHFRNLVHGDVQKNAAQKRYYDFVMSHREVLDNAVPHYYKIGSLVPQVRKDYLERLVVIDADGKRTLKSAKGIAGETKNALGELVIRHENDLEYGLTDENNVPINFLPVFFTKRIGNPSNLSLDFTSALIAHTYSVNDFSEMSKIIDTLEYAKDVVGERLVKTGKFDPVTMFKNTDEKGKPITIHGKDSLAYKRLVDWMEMTVYGKQSKDEGSFGAFDKGKLVDLLNSFTSLSSLALNLYSGISNVTVGSAAVRTEAIAGEFINNKDLLIADKIYAQELPGALAEIGQRLETSKLSLWVEHMDTMQNYDREYRNIDAGRSTLFSRLMKTSSLYFINHAGEHLIQSRMTLALANNTKVKDAAGNEMTLWDAYDVKGNKLVLKEGLTKVSNKEGVGLFRKEEDGQALTERDIIRFINRQNFLNKRLHGIYNNVDKSAAQAYALGRLALMFRKFIKPGWNKRFANLTYNEEGEVFTEGFYTTSARFFKVLFNDLKEMKFSIGKNWNNLNESEKANVHRAMTEVAYLIGTVVVANVLTNIGGDDDDNYMLNLAAYEAYRMYSEMRFFTSITEAWRIVKSPAPSIYTLDKVIKFSEFWNWNKEITKGSFKGQTRFERDATKLVPLLGTGINVMTPEEQLKFYTTNGVSIF